MKKMLPNFNYLVLPEAINDFNEALIWYRKQNKSLPKRLKTDLKITINKLVSNPFAHAVRYADIRIAALSTFPYGIHYHLDEANRIFSIIGIYHESSNPKNWSERSTT